MHLKIENNLNTNIRNAMRSCGYFENFDHRSGKVSYIRNLGRHFYPRFHIYIEENSKSILVNLHIDQKKASYQNQTAHSAEHDSDVVAQEGRRIERILITMISVSSESDDTQDDEKDGFFSKIFG